MLFKILHNHDPNYITIFVLIFEFIPFKIYLFNKYEHVQRTFLASYSPSSQINLSYIYRRFWVLFSITSTTYNSPSSIPYLIPKASKILFFLQIWI